MTQYSPSMPPMQPMPPGYGPVNAPRRGNGAAVASLVLGILGCIPFITGLLAIILGAIGIGKARNPAVGGKGLAIAGLILGILSILGWAVGGGIYYSIYTASQPAAKVAQQFMQDLSANNITAAANESQGISSLQLIDYSVHVSSSGNFAGLRLPNINFSTVNGRTIVHLEGSAIFANGSRKCTFELAKVGDDYKVTYFGME